MFSADGYGAPRDPLVGQIIQERYRIMHAIGKGAMGVVYEAQHLLIGRKVALKTLAGHAVTPAGVQRFRREAQAAAAVGNSHVVDVLDMGHLENGSAYIVMEHLNGADLGFAVALEQRFSVGRAIHVVSQLCDALAAIHAAGIVHRDLKPENIFLTTRDGVPDFVKVLDFGVCKFSDADGGRLTATGDTIGTPLFMAPEQVEGRADCDHRTDIYALGAILYFVLTGRAPFDAPNLPALFLRICHEPAPSVATTESHLTFELDAIVQRALSKDRNARFDSCRAFKAALQSLQTTRDEVAATLPGATDPSRMTEYAWANLGDPGSSLTPTQPPPRRNVRARVLAAVGVGALAASAALGAHFVRAQAPTDAPASTHPVAASTGESLPKQAQPDELPLAAARFATDLAGPSAAKLKNDKPRPPSPGHAPKAPNGRSEAPDPSPSASPITSTAGAPSRSENADVARASSGDAPPTKKAPEPDVHLTQVLKDDP